MPLGTAIQLNIVKDEIRPTLDRMVRQNPLQITKVMGTEGKRITQQHLRARPRNRRGWPTTRFWSRAARATSFEATPKYARVSVNQIGVAQRYYGGPILPHRKQALTIPINRKSYGKVASDFPGLFMLKTKKGAYLVRHGNSRGKKGAFLEFLFKLSKGVKQKGDKTVLPADHTLHEVVGLAVAKLVLRNYERGK